MHLLMSVFAGIGFLYGDAGLEQLLYESDVFAPGTGRHIMSGKDKPCLKGCQLVDEVLQQQLLSQFRSLCEANQKDITQLN